MNLRNSSIMVMFLVLSGVEHSVSHFDEHTAEEALSNLCYEDKDGTEKTEPHWSVRMIEEATKNKSFPEGTTVWDKYVAYNSFYADTCQVLSNDDILKAAHEFYFNDKDYRHKEPKIMRYMSAMSDK